MTQNNIPIVVGQLAAHRMGCAVFKQTDDERRDQICKKMQALNDSRVRYVDRALSGKKELGIEAGVEQKRFKAPSVLKGLVHMESLPEREDEHEWEEGSGSSRSDEEELETDAQCRSDYLGHTTHRLSLITLNDLRAKTIDPADCKYDFENLVFEGGGFKGIAYCGAIRYMEELGLIHQIKNFAGTSVGALVAVLLAIGYTSRDMQHYLSEDISSVLMDAKCGVLSVIPNLLCFHGWHSGKGIYDWIGQKLQDKTGSADITFMELFRCLHKGVCVVVTNVTQMTAEYCHAKTTPDMPVRLAVRMSMAVPGLYRPVKYESRGRTDVYCDGALLCNYPIHCFDGWYLSMKPEDTFLRRLQPLRHLPLHLERQNRFHPPNDKTIGFLLFSEDEEEVLRYRLEYRDGRLEPDAPSVPTKLFRKQNKSATLKERADHEFAKTLTAVDAFLKVLSKHHLDFESDRGVKRSELEAAFRDEEDFDPKYSKLLFGKDFKVQDVFDLLDKDNSGYVSYEELSRFVEEQGICLQRHWHPGEGEAIKSFKDYLDRLQWTVLLNITKLYVQETDLYRTVGINTGHVNSHNIDMEKADQEFIMERGYNSMKAFLKVFAANFPEKVQRKRSQSKRSASVWPAESCPRTYSLHSQSRVSYRSSSKVSPEG